MIKLSRERRHRSNAVNGNHDNFAGSRNWSRDRRKPEISQDRIRDKRCTICRNPVQFKHNNNDSEITRAESRRDMASDLDESKVSSDIYVGLIWLRMSSGGVLT